LNYKNFCIIKPFIIFCLFSLFFCACNSRLEKSPEQQIPDQYNAVSLTSVEYDNTLVSAILSNDGDTGCSIGHAFYIDVKKGSSWYRLPQIPNTMWSMYELSVAPGEKRAIDNTVTAYYGDLSSGQYRYVKEIYIGGITPGTQPIEIAAEFTID